MSAFPVDVVQTDLKSSSAAHSWYRGPSVGYPGHRQREFGSGPAPEELGAIAHLPVQKRPGWASSGPLRALFFAAGPSRRPMGLLDELAWPQRRCGLSYESTLIIAKQSGVAAEGGF